MTALKLVLASACWLSTGANDTVVFQVNDALVKDKPLAGVNVLVLLPGDEAPTYLGETGADGRLQASLPRGELALSFHRDGYVRIVGSPTTIREAGQLITIALTPALEAAGQEPDRRIQLVLTWGSRPDQVKDADAHLACACGQDHVYYADRRHDGEPAHEASLDVDDMDWGGPETITLLDPVPGRYLYWVRNFSGHGALGDSDVVVRVVFGNQLAGEYRAPPGHVARDWRPFNALVVEPGGQPRLEPFSEAELASGQAAVVPDDPSADSCQGVEQLGVVLLFGVLLAHFGWRGLGMLRRLQRRR